MMMCDTKHELTLSVFGETLAANREKIQRKEPPMGDASRRIVPRTSLLGNSRERINRAKKPTAFNT